jgi:hypothetical protein
MCYLGQSIQNSENISLATFELGQYSCIKLLHEMEVIDSDLDDENTTIQEDVEMVTLSGNLCMELSDQRKVANLPDDVYTVPDMMDVCQGQNNEKEKQVIEKLQKGEKEKWGSVLVDKRPTRFQRDGRTVLEKAQDRKKKTNLEEPQGISHNPFSVLSISDVNEIASDVGIRLGVDQPTQGQVVLDMIAEQGDRKLEFDKKCLMCKEISKAENETPKQQANIGEMTPVLLHP